MKINEIRLDVVKQANRSASAQLVNLGIKRMFGTGKRSFYVEFDIRKAEPEEVADIVAEAQFLASVAESLNRLDIVCDYSASDPYITTTEAYHKACYEVADAYAKKDVTEIIDFVKAGAV